MALSETKRSGPRASTPIIADIALVLFGVILAFAIAEIALRVFGLAEPDFYSYDAYRGWGLRPGVSGWQRQEGEAFIQVNRDGFRGPDYQREKPKDTLRIAVLGDSFTEAKQVPLEQTFCAVMERELSAHCPRVAGDSKGAFNKVEVLNFGCDGYGTAQELMTLRRQAWRYSPDVVVLAIFTGNDIRNNSVVLEGDQCRPFFVLRDGQTVLGGSFWDSLVFRTQCMMRFESRHFATLDLAGKARSAARARLNARRDLGSSKAQKFTGSELGLNDLVYREPSGQVWLDAWKVTDAEIAMMNREVTSRGAIFLAVTMTNGVQVYPDPQSRKRYMTKINVQSLSYPDDHVRALGERENFPVLNLAAPMQAYADEHHVFLHGFRNTQLGTGHWNAEGHRVGGELIARRVCELLEHQP